MSLHIVSAEPPAAESLVWQTVAVSPSGTSAGGGGGAWNPPKARALHVGAVIEDAFYLHGGYDGMNRCADFWKFDFLEAKWHQLLPSSSAPVGPQQQPQGEQTAGGGGGGGGPSARDRHACVVADRKMYIFGGYDGSNRVNDLWEYEPRGNKWTEIVAAGGPSPRHSHCMFQYERKIFVLFGYDGNYRHDLHAFDLDARTWTTVGTKAAPGSSVPKARYRNSATVVKDKLLVFGGHDGARHLGDVYLLNLNTFEWSEVTSTGGGMPSPRDSHSAVLHSNGQVVVFGGSSGTARADLLAFNVEKRSWQEWKYAENGQSPVPRFCHVAVMYKNCMYVNSGYDGQTRLNDFKKLPLPDNIAISVPESTLLSDLRGYVNSERFSDIAFVLDDGVEVKAHRILLARSPYFACMLSAEMQESIEGKIRLREVNERVLLKLLEIIYTDEVYIEEEDMSFVLELLVIADRYAVERLKAICEVHIIKNVNFDNAASILQVADQHSAMLLRSKSMDFILKHFDAVSKSKAFEDLAKHNVELLLEIIKKR